MSEKNNNGEIADLLFPKVTDTIEKYIDAYPPRDLPVDAKVTRFSPSPTGFLHIGGLFSATVSERLAHQSGGVFYLRIEDTDKKREVEDGVIGITSALRKFGVKIDEGVKDDGSDFGAYGPYTQSKRKDIYAVFAKHLVDQGDAYPCFCTPEELEEVRKSQELQKVRPGYYGKWATHRNNSVDDIKKNLAEGKQFVIRMRSTGDETKKIPFNDLIKGEVSVTENDQDTVLLKSDGLPTYHFAHVVDDYLMRTTHVLRGDEWLSSLPIHLQLFAMFDWPTPYFGHISPILKSENGNKRKLSKRKDPESAVDYYLSAGYPNEAVFDYLLNIANSDFEEWRKNNPDKPFTDFNIRLEKLSKSGALFDFNKLTDISKDVIAKMSAEKVYEMTLRWAEEYDKSFAEILSSNKEYALKILNIERNTEKPRKDFAKWSDVKENIFYFFDNLYEEYVKSAGVAFPENLSKELVTEVVYGYIKNHDHSLDKDSWSAKLKEFAESLGFAKDMKTFKQNPTQYKGHIGDVAMILRIAVTSKSKTPDLYEIMQTMGEEMTLRRLNSIVG